MRNNSEARRQMFEMIDQWKQSGLSQKSFCEKKPSNFIRYIIGINANGNTVKPLTANPHL